MSIYDKASLVLIPSGTKTSKVYSQKPVNGDGDFTFSRSTAATRVNADGNIEKETQNFLLQSNSFNNSSWLKTGSPIFTSGQSDPFGGNDAWKFESSNAVSTQIYQSALFNTGSIYAKAGNVSSFSIWANLNVTFDLSSGTITSGAANGTIEGVGGGWYRCTIFNPTANVFNPNFIATAAGEFVYIAFSQAEQGLVARDYIETTTAAVEGGITDNVPRLDYTDSSCPALLLEPQRTNLASLSEYFAGWNNQTNATITSNYTTSPEGLDNASRLLFTANGYIINSGYPNQSTGTQYTLSCYAKRNDNGTQNFGFFKNGSGAVDGAMALTSEWQRFDYTYTASNGSQLGLAGINGADVSVYGFQVEANASYATSYIPTYGTSVTRNADVCNNTSATDVIGQSEGTLFVDFVYNGLSNSNGAVFLLLTANGGASNRVQVSLGSVGDIVAFALGSGASLGQANTSSNYLVKGTRYKVGVNYSVSGGLVLYVNGTLIDSDTLTSVPSRDRIHINDYLTSGSYIGNLDINQTLLFKTRLSNEELAALTTI